MNISIKFKGFSYFIALLQVALIVLKLLGKITWSWVFVFAPIWGSCLLTAFIFFVVVLIYVLIFDRGNK